MKKIKFTEAQIAFILKQAEDGTAITEVCRKAGISDATFYNWRKKYAGLMPSETKRLRQLEEENAKLNVLWRTCRSTRPCYRMCFQKSSKACSQAPTGRWCSVRLESIDQACLFGFAD